MKKINDIKGFEMCSDYEIYEDGAIISYKKGKKKILKGYLNTRGYLLVDLGRHRRAVKIHRLIAIAFIPNPENKPQVNHIDGNKTNNKVNNLEWATNSENQLHANKLGLRNVCKGDEHYNFNKKHSTCKMVAQLSSDNEVIATYYSLAQASRAVGGKSYSGIAKCCNGKYKTAFGYKWKFVNGE